MTEVKQGSRTPNIGKRQIQEYKSTKPIITSPHFSTEISNGLTPKQILFKDRVLIQSPLSQEIKLEEPPFKKGSWDQMALKVKNLID